MKTKTKTISLGVQDLCRKLKIQLEELGRPTPADDPREKEAARAREERRALVERLKRQLLDLSR